MTDPTAAENLRAEFNRWAEAGRGEGMEEDHLPIALPMLAKMALRADENVLDVGCGAGWLVRLIAREVTEGRIVGMDISDEMVRHARRVCADVENALFIVGAAEEIPWEPNFFTRAVSVESSYYWPDPAHALREIFRVLREGGEAWILINYYRDNPYCHQWGALLSIPAKLLSAEEWAALFRDAGFFDVAHERIVDPTPAPEVYTGRWFRDAAELAAFRREGALLVRGKKDTGSSIHHKNPG
ncbi:MAG TPA: methyltransferase domain-containing protein [Candidatus Acidoferrum sp.]|nr:methyltransferase domain-containing protein [Candidatus Acidoferrum sp.]